MTIHIPGGAYYTSASAAVFWGVDVSHVRRLSAQGRLPALRVGRNWILPAAEVEGRSKTYGDSHERAGVHSPLAMLRGMRQRSSRKIPLLGRLNRRTEHFVPIVAPSEARAVGEDGEGAARVGVPGDSDSRETTRISCLK